MGRSPDIPDAIFQVEEGLRFLDILFFTPHERDT